MQKNIKHILILVAVILLTGMTVLLVGRYQSSLKSSVLGDLQGMYLNPFDLRVSTTTTSNNGTFANIDQIKTSTGIRLLDVGALGVVADGGAASGSQTYKAYAGMKESYGAFLESIGLRGVRLFNFGYDLIMPPEEGTDFAKKGYLSAEDYVRTTMSGATLGGPTRFIFMIDSNYGYDPNETYVASDGTTKRGVSHFILEDPAKYIPMLAKHAADIVQVLKDTYGEAAFEKFYFEIGNEDYFSLPSKVHADAVVASLREMRKIVPTVKVAFNMNPSNNGDIVYKPTGNGTKYENALRAYLGANSTNADLYDFDNEEVFKRLYDLDRQFDIKKNLVGMQIHSYIGAERTAKILNDIRVLREKYNFPGVTFWFDEYHVWGRWGSFSAQNATTYLEYLKDCLGVLSMDDVLVLDILALPGTAQGQSMIYGLGNDPDYRLNIHMNVDPYLNAAKKETAFWLANPMGIAQKVLTDFFFETGRKFSIKQYVRGTDVTVVAGEDEGKHVKGIFLNSSAIPQTVTVQSTTDLYMAESRYKTIPGYLNSWKQISDDVSPKVQVLKNALSAHIASLASTLPATLESYRKGMRDQAAPIEAGLRQKAQDLLAAKTPWKPLENNLLSNPLFAADGAGGISNWPASSNPPATLKPSASGALLESTTTTNTSTGSWGFTIQYSNQQAKLNHEYVAIAQVKKTTPTSSVRLSIANNPFQAGSVEETAVWRLTEDLSETEGRYVATPPVKFTKGFVNGLSVLIFTTDKLEIMSAGIIDCTEHPENSACVQHTANEMTDIHIATSLLSIMENREILNTQSTLQAKFYEYFFATSDKIANWGLPTFSREPWNDYPNNPLYYYAWRVAGLTYLQDSITEYTAKKGTEQEFAAFRNVLRDALMFNDKDTYAPSKTNNPSSLNQMMSLYLADPVRGPLDKIIADMKISMQELADIPGWLDAYIADLRLERIPETLQKKYTPQNGVITITMPAGSLLMFSEKEIQVRFEQTLMESLSLVQKVPEIYDKMRHTASISQNSSGSTFPVNNNSILDNNLLISQVNSNIQTQGNFTISEKNMNINTIPGSTLTTALPEPYVDIPQYYAGYGSNSSTLGTLPTSSFLRSSAPTQPVPFVDIAKSSAKDAIEALYRKGIIQGKTKDRFAPSSTLNRAEALALLYKAYPQGKTAESFMQQFLSLHKAYTYVYFKDVSIRAWFAGYVGLAKEAGIVQGKTLSEFAPSAEVSTAEFLKMLLLTSNTASSCLKNAAPAKTLWYTPYMTCAKEKQLLQKLISPLPTRTLTRGEAAMLVYALMQ